MYVEKTKLSLNDVIYFILKKFERNRLTELFQNRAELDFSEYKALHIAYTDKSVITEINTIIRQMVD